MKFLCVECDRRMSFAQRQVPGDGTLAAVFECDGCGRAVALLTNPMETQLVSSLDVEIGGRTVPEQPMELTRRQVEAGREDAFDDASPSEPEDERSDGGSRVTWTEEAEERLGRVPSFVRGMVRRIYTDWAREREIDRVTPDVMDRARTDLGLEGM